MMTAEPTIPHGYKRIQGQLQKGDGIWNGKRFEKVKRQYPFIGTLEAVAIRRCEVVQPEIAETVECEETAP